MGVMMVAAMKMRTIGVGPRAGHESVSDKPEAHQRQHDYRQFKGQAEANRESRHERIVLLHRPGRRPAERLRVAKEKEDRLWQQPEIADQHADQEQARS